MSPVITTSRSITTTTLLARLLCTSFAILLFLTSFTFASFFTTSSTSAPLSIYASRVIIEPVIVHYVIASRIARRPTKFRKR